MVETSVASMSARTLRFTWLAITLGVLGVALRESHAPVEAQDAPQRSAELPLLSPPADFSLEETSGALRTLTEVRGRIVLVFYEDREHTSDNQALKHTLHRYVLDNGLRERIATYGVANVSGVDGVVRDMARAAIRTIAGQYGIQILMDWTGALQRAPFGFPAIGATIAVFDGEGRMRYRVTGAHTTEQQSELFRTIRRLVRAGPQGTSSPGGTPGSPGGAAPSPERSELP